MTKEKMSDTEYERGVSFLIRARDEEKTIGQSIESLLALTIPHEIIIVLHLCTDRSEEIVSAFSEANDQIKVYTYEHEISRAGYQTLATDKASKHHLVTYSNWCFDKANYPWIFKWDADFIATNDLITFLNERDWVKEKKAYRICAKNSTHCNKEPYLMSGVIGYSKYIFWEVMTFSHGTEFNEVPDNVYIEHSSELDDIKSYWNKDPWYLTSDKAEASLVISRMESLEQEFGPEPVGMARASNPECDTLFFKIKQAQPSYVNFTE